MKAYNLAAIHDRIDEEHFQVHLNTNALDALQRKVALLEAQVRELTRLLLEEPIEWLKAENPSDSCSSPVRSRRSKRNSTS